jgi:CRISPR-associated protein Cmr1
MAIHRVAFEGEVITPLFMNGNTDLELRVPALRGGLRYWLRVLLGGIGVQSSERLKRCEAEVFGDTDGQSAVLITLKENNPKVSNTNMPSSKTPVGYLWYSFKLKGNENRKSYLPGTRFQVEFISRDKSALDRCICALWCLSFLGGLGARSRRAAGSIQFAVKGSDLTNRDWPSFDIARAGDLMTFYQDNLSIARELLRKYAGGGSGSGVVTPQFDSLHENTAAVYVLRLDRYSFGQRANPKAGVFGKPRNYRDGGDGFYRGASGAPVASWENAVAALGAGMQDYRLRRGIGGQNNGYDYDRIRQNLHHGNYGKIERTIFGLPLAFRFSGGQFLIINRGKGKDERQASPLWLKVVKTDAGYEGIATIFGCRMDNLWVKGIKRAKDGKAKAPQPLPELKSFIESQFIHAQEVVL